MNTVVFHPWPSLAGNSDNPDQLRIDLDPQPGRGLADAVEAAQGLKGLLEVLALTPWV
jgi:DNA primase